MANPIYNFKEISNRSGWDIASHPSNSKPVLEFLCYKVKEDDIKELSYQEIIDYLDVCSALLRFYYELNSNSSITRFLVSGAEKTKDLLQEAKDSHPETIRLQKEKEKQQREYELKRERERDEWISQGLCSYCGGKIGGLFVSKCKRCKRRA
jgi:hypothetical protein